MASGTTSLNNTIVPAQTVVREYNVDYFAILLVLGLFAFVGMTYWRVPLVPGDTFGVILGYMAGWVSAIVGFRYGTSLTSKAKDATIATQATALSVKS